MFTNKTGNSAKVTVKHKSGTTEHHEINSGESKKVERSIDKGGW